MTRRNKYGSSKLKSEQRTSIWFTVCLISVRMRAYCSTMNNVTPSRTVAGNVRAEAARLGIDNQTLSRGLQQNRVTLGRSLRGERPFTIDEIVSLAQVLGTPVSTLLAGVVDAERAAS